MLSLRLSVISVCLAAVNVLSASIRKDSVTKASLPKSFEWSSSGPLISPKNDNYDLAGIKDPSIVEVGGVYHVFASTAKEAGYHLVYLSFTDFMTPTRQHSTTLIKAPSGQAIAPLLRSSTLSHTSCGVVPCLPKW